MTAAVTCDIFCRVVDNYGDIGVSWRLANQLAAEHGLSVRLIVDDLASLARLAPAVVIGCREQSIGPVRVVSWREDFVPLDAADLVIEAFACTVPEAYVSTMATRVVPPVWLNLEYLSAETWVATHHLAASPQPRGSLIKHFFFPGFSTSTGGLIREQGLLGRREAYCGATRSTAQRVLVFAYPGAPAPELLAAAAGDGYEFHIVDGALANELKHRCGTQPQNALEAAPVADFTVQAFVPQASFDELLWDHHLLFVRGEDSFVRAQWAGKPFIWQIYPQGEDAHRIKLEAFLDLYCHGMEPHAAAALRALWAAWNGWGGVDGVARAWRPFRQVLPAVSAHARNWSDRLAQQPDLASNLLSFFRKNTKI